MAERDHKAMKKIIGIVPTADLYEDDFPHHDIFQFCKPYADRLARYGAVPIGVLAPEDAVQEEALSLCDGFVLTGGSKIWPYHLQVVEHAWKTRKPLLGICLGMQAISAFFHVQARVRTQGGDTLSQFDAMKKERYMFTLPVKDHALENVTRETAEASTHPIEIVKGTRLYETWKKTSADAVSLHSYRIPPIVEGLTVSAVAPDGTIEGIEYGGTIVGVQFHPEVDDAWDCLFAAFLGGTWLPKA